jgi:diguanylate cyclase (GGDEF)-like protein/PAS domain S-box-containing protein
MARQSTDEAVITSLVWQRLVVLAIATLNILLGLTVIGAWYLHISVLIQVIPNSPPIRYNTALGILLSGLALLALQRKRYRALWALSVGVMLIGGLTLVQYISGIDLAIDQLFVQDYITNQFYAPGHWPAEQTITKPIQQLFITIERPLPGRPSPNAALGLLFVGIALLCLGTTRQKQTALRRFCWQSRIEAIAVACATGAIGIGTVTLLGYVTQFGTAHTWRYLTGVAIPTSVGLLSLGIALLLTLVLQGNDQHLSRWLFPSAGFGVCVASLMLWQSLLSWSYSFVDRELALAAELESLLIPTANLILTGGLLLAALITGVLFLYRQVYQRSELLKQVNHYLAKTSSLFQATLESTADGILVLDTERVVLHANTRFNQMWSIPASLSASVRSGDQAGFDFILEQVQEPDTFRAATQAMMQALEQETFDRFTLKDGKIFERYSRPFWLGERVAGKVLSYRDVTERQRMEIALRQSEARFHAFVDKSPVVAFMKNDQGQYVYINHTLERIFETSFAFLEGKTDFDWLPAEIARITTENDQAVLATNQPTEYIETVPNGDGTSLSWLTFKFPFQDSSGKHYVGGVGVDLTERKQIEEALFQEKELAQVTLDSIGDAVITTDASGKVQYLNPVAAKLTGWSATDAHDRPLAEIFSIIHEVTREVVENPVDKALAEKTVTSLAEHTLLIAQDGREIPINDSAAPIYNRAGQVVGAVMVFHDVTQTRNLSQQLSWQASHDSLTGLVNRREFEQRLVQALSNARTENECHVLCYLDLDQFKIVNDTCGHSAGDELLRQVTALLQDQIRKNDTLSRLGGDEFGILLNGCPLDQAIKVGEKLRQAVESYRFVWQDNTFAIGVSIGLVAIHAQSEDLSRLLIAADSACYGAKNNGRNRVHVFEADDQEVLQQQGQLRWVNQINKALAENRFCLHSQPIREIATSESSEEHCEVLLRLQDETGNLISPMAFIPAAERYNLMHKIDRWVIKTLFQHWSSLQPCRQNRVYAINLSGASINDDQFIHFIHEQFAKSAVPPHLICFEITETVAIANLTKASQFIRNLQTLGCRFALDDFGSGMSSFAYLKNLPVNYLKIDGGFVKDIVDDPINHAMVGAINQIGHVI